MNPLQLPPAHTTSHTGTYATADVQQADRQRTAFEPRVDEDDLPWSHPARSRSGSADGRWLLAYGDLI